MMLGNGFEIAAGAPRYLRHAKTAALAPHGFFSAEGGVSTGIYASLNCGYGSADDPALVSQNRSAAAATLNIDSPQLVAVYQVHGTTCITVDAATPVYARRDQMIRADGIITAQPGLALSILTADCLPLLLTDADATVIGACHAGWRGAVAGIVASTVAAMQDAGAGEITAMIGPTIRQPSYQVGKDMRDESLSLSPSALRDKTASCFLADGPDHFRFDLARLVRHHLTSLGVAAVHDCAVDTYTAQNSSPDSLPFFSHRLATHHHQSDSGRQISVIRKPAQ